MWRKGNPCALLVGLPIGAAVVENKMKIPQKTRTRSTIRSCNSTSGYLTKANKNTNSKRYMHPRPMFTAVLFIIAKKMEAN